jgi:hypothetical protein
VILHLLRLFSGDTIFNKINEINLGNNIEKIKTFSQTEIDTLQFLLYELGEIKKDFNIFHNKYKEDLFYCGLE